LIETRINLPLESISNDRFNSIPESKFNSSYKEPHYFLTQKQ
jgi:hypothetical protein